MIKALMEKSSISVFYIKRTFVLVKQYILWYNTLDFEGEKYE